MVVMGEEAEAAVVPEKPESTEPTEIPDMPAIAAAQEYPEMPADRWPAKEREALVVMRLRCKDALAQQAPFPEVVGDRRLLRFLRGRGGNINEATEQYLGHLKWRRENGVDQVRQNIVYGGCNDAKKFPNGEKLLRLAPQIIVAPVKDKNGFPIVTEQYNFSPKRLFQESSLNEYLLFLIYALEFRTIVMEHMAFEEDLLYLRAHPDPSDRREGWGSFVRNCTIRDLGALSWEHIGSDGRAFIKAAVSLGSPNYPESLGKAHMINTPFFFNAIWSFVKLMLDANTLEKVAIWDHNYMSKLLLDVPLPSIPKEFGGTYDKGNEKYDIDYTKNGPVWYEGCPEDPAKAKAAQDALDEEQRLKDEETEQQQQQQQEQQEQQQAQQLGEGKLESSNSGKAVAPAARRSSLTGANANANANANEPDNRDRKISNSSSSSSSAFNANLNDNDNANDNASFSAGDNDPFYSPRRVTRSLSVVGQRVLESSEEVVRREVLDPFYYLSKTSPALTLGVVVFVAHVLIKLDVQFLRFFVIPFLICFIDMTIGLRF